MKKTAVAVLLQVAALMGVQHFGLERTREKQTEDRYSAVPSAPGHRDGAAGVKASQILPQYIASLFLGAFRALVVDMLWVELHRMRNQEHRYFEAVEIMDMISLLQPRNAEVWSYQAQDAAYNIANHLRDPQQRWQWIKKGFRKLVEGSGHLPQDPYLKEELALNLLRKSTLFWDGNFEEEFLRRAWEDDEFQNFVQGRPDDAPVGLRRTPFEMALPWLERAQQNLKELKGEQKFKFQKLAFGQQQERDYHTTAVGRNVLPSSLDGWRYVAMYYQGYHLLRGGRLPEASEWFARAAAQAREIVRIYPGQSLVGIYEDRAKLCDGLTKATATPPRTAEERLALLQSLTAAMLAGGGDFGYLRSDLAGLKREFGGDEFEFNDDIDFAARVEYGRVTGATAAPRGDVDLYTAPIPWQAEDDGHDHGGKKGAKKKPFPPHRVAFQVKRIGDADLKVTLWTFTGGNLGPSTMEVRGDRWEEIEGVTDQPGLYLQVEELAPGAPIRDPRYLFRWSMAEPVR